MPKKRYFKFDPTAFNKLYADFELNSNTGDEEAVEFLPTSENQSPRRKFEGFSF